VDPFPFCRRGKCLAQSVLGSNAPILSQLRISDRAQQLDSLGEGAAGQVKPFGL